MPHPLPTRISYLVTTGTTTSATTASSEEFRRLLSVVERAVAARITLVQLREKRLSARTLHELATRAAALTAGSATRLLVNDRADIARSANCDGVHLTTQSLPAAVVRRTFGPHFLIGVSTHSLDEAHAARDGGADFAVFGPVFETPTKRGHGAPVGLDALREAAHALAPFPIVALGGVAKGNVRDVLQTGARGIAAIRLFDAAENLRETVREIEARNV